MRHLVLLTALLVHVQNHPVTGQTLKDVLKSDTSQSMTFGNNILWVDFANVLASEASNRISSSHWSIRVASHYSVLIRHGSHYKVYLNGALLCFKTYYKYCLRGNAVEQARELKSQHAPECMRLKFLQPKSSQNARIWDIPVPLGFQINLTVTDLKMTHHPRGQCYGNLGKDGPYTGQGLAIDNYGIVCQRTKRRSYFLPMSKARIILNHTHIPDCPVLEFMYGVIIPQESMKSYLTLAKIFFKVIYFTFFKTQKVVW